MEEERTNQEWLSELRPAPPRCNEAMEALLRILDRLDSFRGESRFMTWANTVAVRVALAERSKARWRDVSLGQAMRTDCAAPGERCRAREAARAILMHLGNALET